MKRSSGIIMHITSLPNKYGIGTFGKEAFDFVDFLKRAGQKYWQLLPLGPTSFGDSPYQSFSAFAGNPYFIDLDILVKDGILEKGDFKDIDLGENEDEVNYYKIFKNKMEVLKKAYSNNKNRDRKFIEEFKSENKVWLEDYSLFMALKNKFDLKSWQKWPEDIKLREKEAMNKYSKELEDEVNYWVFLQYHFYKQWNALKGYANGLGINIIGDIPIYVSEDSADAWAFSEIFMLDDKKIPIRVAGCPPDSFSRTGQLWGNPLYDWDYLDETNYSWWVNRIRENLKLYDVIRIDHFRGFESYWSIPYEEDTAINGKWVKGPGNKLFKAIKDALGNINIIAEDLGYLTQEVIDFREETGFPGMKVLQFAFDTREESDYLPHNYNKNCVVYTGTHDNDTFMGWFENSGNKEDVSHAVKYLKLNKDEGYNWGFIRGAWSSVGALAIAPIQDFLGLGSEARINTPSTLGANWKWRAKAEQLTGELADKINEITSLYGR
ncbi:MULTISPECIES: 4-alpha-glucanotransferase [unclassified Clostridium]|uniref:4-alpha-glucanotransferase n=1 Tax=unclassified Clostridium TaxID=2614128 RepID=UPI001EEF1FFD|nr:4-alpha-glucanotransferase [Clostridium sp. UBA1652]